MLSTAGTTSLSTQNLASVRQGEYRGTNAAGGVEAVASTTIPIEARTYFRWEFGNEPRQRQSQSTCVATGPPYSDMWKGIAVNTTAKYRFLGGDWAITIPNSHSVDARLPIRKAFEDWEDANEITGLTIDFDEPTDGSVVQLQIRRDFVGIDFRRGIKKGGKTTVTEVPANGIIAGAAITFSDDVNLISRWNDFLRVGLHELGHVLGLDDDVDGTGGSSVMNLLSGPHDQRGFISMVVTRCDRDTALSAPLSVWPR